ncbi:Protein of unknown function [Filimonas lacunae]|uniref:Pvc16 N-terminal domain-containing protein n=1 Tax=Filimonas lacunae TaxID=477680 RepID=A0A173MG50_9BACT|nr:DUF4255 domain-containing protein [Filimonas lacunae]BAV06604.1 glutamine synthetase adenylyltransferase [Filimonas lacunae]SIT27551.1 Protein of unknown function [Filimonas lacunae]
MSNALAIAAVTQVLKDLLNDGLINNDVTGSLGTTVTVTTTAPDRVDTSVAGEQSQLNLFMYQVSVNSGWRNHNLPSHNAAGERINNPPLALDLHYLLTAYGATDLHPEILLGYGMQLLHDHPILSREAIRKSLQPVSGDNSFSNLPLSLRSLASSKLDEQVELLKITPEQLSAEELSKFWTAFQNKYRPTAAYKVTVVLIESEKSTKVGLPVKERGLYVMPFNQPVIKVIKSQVTAGAPVSDSQPILPGYRLVLEGTQLAAQVVKLHIDGKEIAATPQWLSAGTLAFTLPADISAGVHGVQVSHPVNMGNPPVLHAGAISTAEAFVLHPQLTNIQVNNAQGSGTQPRSADITLKINPGVGTTQKVLLLLNEVDSGAPGVTLHAYSFSWAQASPPAPGPFTDIVIPIHNVAAGAYLVRIQIDGVQSVLGTDGNGKYNTPQLVLA